MRRNRLYFNIQFLGYQFSPTEIKPLPDKVAALRELPPPKDAKQLQSILGMFSFYQRCIPQFSAIALPLRNLLNMRGFTWTEEHAQSFNDLKHHLSEAVELAYPLPNATYTITADASSFAIGACLHQVIDGDSSPLRFFSRKLSDTETHYSTFDKELLAALKTLNALWSKQSN